MSNDARIWIFGGDNRSACEPDRLVPRPQNQRTPNEYVDTPFQHRVRPNPRHQAPAAVHSSSRSRSAHSKPHSEPSPHKSTSQTPQPTTFAKELLDQDSIICARCGRCKCEACATVPKAGSVWLCGGKCLCSPATAVDYVSCLCCVRGALYHCAPQSDDQTPAVDSPCSCVGPNTLLRWACMALASIPLPCLLCYWPLEGTRRLCEGTYRRFHSQGCKCPRPDQPPVIRQPEKGLLHDFM